jgi:hypothetical protein
MTPKINIVHYSEVIDNHGNTVGSEKPKDIIRVLRNSKDWTDCMIFHDNFGYWYDIDDLIGKTVVTGNYEILVEETEEPIDEAREYALTEFKKFKAYGLTLKGLTFNSPLAAEVFSAIKRAYEEGQ